MRWSIYQQLPFTVPLYKSLLLFFRCDIAGIGTLIVNYILQALDRLGKFDQFLHSFLVHVLGCWFVVRKYTNTVPHYIRCMKRSDYFNITLWCITGSVPPPDVANRLRVGFIGPLWALHERTRKLFTCSQRSGYRPRAYELDRGRSGGSLHCFAKDTLGAVDLLPPPGMSVLDAGELLRENIPFRRVCAYPGNGFLHVDYGFSSQYPVEKSRAQRYLCKSPTSAWVRVPTFRA